MDLNYGVSHDDYDTLGVNDGTSEFDINGDPEGGIPEGAEDLII